MCGRLTYCCTGKHTLVTRALAMRHTRRRCDGCKSVLDCFLPPPHRKLVLDNNLACVPLTIEARVAMNCTPDCTYGGPATLCISCEAGKFATTSSPCCSSLYHEHRPLGTCLLSMVCVMSNMLYVMPLVLLRTQEVSPRLRNQREHEMPLRFSPVRPA